LHDIHLLGLTHSNLHAGNVVFDCNVADIPYVSGLGGFSRSVKSSSTIQGVLPFVAPEVFRTRDLTQKSDIQCVKKEPGNLYTSLNRVYHAQVGTNLR